MARFTQGGSSNFGGAELNYIQVVGTQQVISSAPNAIVDLDITTTGKAVQISVTGEGANASAGSWLRLNLFRDNVEIGNAIQLESSAVSENVPFAINFIDDVPAGTYNYSARVTSITGGSWTFGEAAGPVINAVELTGFKGDRGLRGFKGDQGEPGVAGADGPQGATGPQGEAGPAGSDGAPGQDGINGLSAYEVAVENGFEGTEQEWLDSLGGSGTADIADFTFEFRPENEEEEISAKSSMTIHNHDMLIQTTRDGEQDSDISIDSADDVWITANDSIELTSLTNEVVVYAGAASNQWTFQSDAGLRFPDQTVQTTAYTGGAASDIADFVFTGEEGQSTISLPSDRQMRIQAGETSDLYLTAGDDIYIRTTDEDIRLQAGDDIRFASNYDADVESGHFWRMDSEGEFHLPGSGLIWNPSGTSSDGFGNDTIHLVPSDSDNETEQRIIIDPTGPNHIHIRAGGDIDQSTAELILGGEKNKVAISDSNKTVIIGTAALTQNTYVNANELSNEDFILPSTANIQEGSTVNVDGIEYPVTSFEVDPMNDGFSIVRATGASFVAQASYTFTIEESYNHSWEFNPNGYLSGPAMGGLFVTGILNGEGDLYLGSDQNIILSSGDGGEFIGDPSEPGNQIATLGDIQAGASTGDITFVESTISNDTGDDIVIENKNEDGIVKASIRLDQGNEQVSIRAIASDSEWFNDTQWSTAVWAGSVVTITNTPDIINFIENAPGNITRVSINDGGLITYEGAGYGPGDITINVGGTPVAEEDPLTVTEIRFYYELVSEINIDHDDSEFNIVSRGMSMTIDSSGDLELTARDEDIDLRAKDDIKFTANWDNNGTQQEWRMDSDGKFQLPGDGYIENVVNGSGDGSGNDTIKIVPDSNRESTDQYLIIDPTFGSPNHIHIRAGGQQDNSNADVILGAERTNVRVSDTDGAVFISSKRPDTTNIYENVNGDSSSIFAIFADLSHISPNANFSVDVDGTLYVIDSAQVFDIEGSPVTELTATPATFVTGMSYMIHESNGENNWAFTDEGYVLGPAMSSLLVTGVVNGDGNLYVQSNSKVVISGGEAGGEFLNDPENPQNQIATFGNVVSFINEAGNESSTNAQGGTTGDQPTFNGSPMFNLAFTRYGLQVHFHIRVDMDNITNFGTGQYYLDLPYLARYAYQFRDGCLHDDSTGNQYAIGGHVAANSRRLFLNYTGTNGHDEVFDHNSPVTLTTADNFHISGTYLINPVE